jgi:hypothetical protein
VVQEVYENNNTRAEHPAHRSRPGRDELPRALRGGHRRVVLRHRHDAQRGGGTAAASTTRYYLSANGLLDAGDVAIGSRAVASLAPGATSTGSAVVTIPAGTVGGQYYLIAAADADGVVAETTESNNIINRGITIGSDLHVLTFTAPSDAGAGIAISITDTTRNQGTGSAGASTTSFYLSLDATLDAGDVLLGSRAIPALAGGASSSGSTSVTIPAGTATGNYTLFARADSGDAVSEAVETEQRPQPLAAHRSGPPGHGPHGAGLHRCGRLDHADGHHAQRGRRQRCGLRPRASTSRPTGSSTRATRCLRPARCLCSGRASRARARSRRRSLPRRRAAPTT